VRGTVPNGMKKAILREILWFFVALLLSVPLAFVFIGMLKLTSGGPELNDVEKVFTLQLFLIGAAVSFVCVYVVRLVYLAIRHLVGGGGGSGKSP